ncbi:MAG: nucleoside diphosphate kinase regulator [bacterium]|nr:nucleoside diphosphate kinase regulator [Candidatus Sumerlaeota bacterium]
MTERGIFITEFDMRRLGELLQVAMLFGRNQEIYLKALNTELNKAQIVKPQEVPADVVTMNSKVRVKFLTSGQSHVYTLVFPSDANIEKKCISVLAPMGTAILGYKVGKMVEWDAPNGHEKLVIEEIIYQPEAAGDFHL